VSLKKPKAFGTSFWHLPSVRSLPLKEMPDKVQPEDNGAVFIS
jgi:hypothetical protein